MKAIRITTKQGSAHFRRPFAYRHRLTYLLPPYSTVIGFILNLLGIKENPERLTLSELLKEKIGLEVDHLLMAIYTSWNGISHGTYWYRNITVSEKKKETPNLNRIVNGEVEHIGKQSPIVIEELEEVENLIYIAFENEKLTEKFCEKLKEFKTGDKIHLGRSEDILRYLDIKLVDLEESENYNPKIPYFSWIPHYEPLDENFDDSSYNQSDEYKKFFDRIKSYTELINTVYKIEGNVRNFRKICVKLLTKDSTLPMYLEENRNFRFLVDNEKKLPIWFAKISLK